MNILDENVPEGQRQQLRQRRIHVRQIGVDAGRKGMNDDEIIPLLLQFDRPTFFTFDRDFYCQSLCHDSYCLVYLDIDEENAAHFIQGLLRNRKLNTKAKRMGLVIRVTVPGINYFMKGHDEEFGFP
jgi:uncharacterized protein DUF5615